MKPTILEKIASFIGLFCLMIIATGTLFRVMHWPGGAVMLIAGVLLTTTFFIPLFTVGKVRIYPSSAGKVFLIMSAFFVETALIGYLFKTMHWPGAGLMVIFGFSLGPLLGYLPLLIIDAVTKKERSYLKPGMMMLGLILACLALTIWGLQPGRNLLQTASVCVNGVNIENDNLKHQIEVLSEHELKGAYKATDEMAIATLDYIQECKEELLIAVGEPDIEAAINDATYIYNKDNYDIVTYFMSSNYDSESEGSRQQQLLQKVFDLESKWSEITGLERFRIMEISENSMFSYSEENQLFQFEHVPLAMAMNQIAVIEQLVLSMQCDIRKESFGKQSQISNEDNS